MYFIYLLVFGLILLGLVVNALFKELDKEYKNKLMIGMGVFFTGVLTCFVISTIFLTAKYGRMANLLVEQF